MKRFKTKQIALCVAAALLSTAAVPAAFAASFTDTAGHWAENAINVWSDRGVIQGFDGFFNPNDHVTRAEAASILTGAIGYTDEEGTVFTDVAEDAWYAKVVKKASAAKAINGDGTGLFRPNDKITREEAAVIFANAFGIAANEDVSAFSDAGDVSEWAKGAVGGMTAAGYLSGDNGAYCPKRALTRAEIVTILNNMVRTYIDQAGTYTQNNTNGGIILVKAGGVTLNTITADGIVISPAVGNGSVTIQNVSTKRDIKNLAPGANVQATGTSVVLPGVNTGTTGGVSNSGGGGGSTTGALKNSKLTVDKVLTGTDLSGKQPEDLMENIDVTTSDYVAKVKGTLKYITGFTEYSEKPEEQNGYFIALRIVPGSSKTSKLDISVEAPDYSESFGTNDLDEGALIILRRVDTKLISNGITCRIDLDGNGTSYRETTYTINLSGLTLEPSVQLLPADDTAQLLGDEKASDLMEDIQIVKKTKSNIEFDVTGSLKYYSNYTAFSDVKSEQSGNYLAIRMIPKINTEDTTVTIVGTTTKTFSKKDNPEVFEEDGSLITIWRVTDKLKEKNIVYRIDYDGSGKTFEQEDYILDISDVELLEKEETPALTVAPAANEKAVFDNGFTQADFVESFKLSSDKDKKNYVASGALKYVENIGYAPEDERDSGHFVILEVVPDPEQWRVTKSTITLLYPGNGAAEWAEKSYSNTDLEDGKLYLCVRADDIQDAGIELIVYFDGIDDTTYPEYVTVDFSGVEKLPKPVLTISAAAEQAGFVNTFKISDDGAFNLAADGELEYEEGGNLVLELVPAADWTAEGTIKVEYADGTEEIDAQTYGDADLQEGKLLLNVPVDNILKASILKITIDLDGEGETAAVQSYTVDFSAIQKGLMQSQSKPTGGNSGSGGSGVGDITESDVPVEPIE